LDDSGDVEIGKFATAGWVASLQGLLFSLSPQFVGLFSFVKPTLLEKSFLFSPIYKKTVDTMGNFPIIENLAKPAYSIQIHTMERISWVVGR
jgi:hypothetical protein